MKMEMQQRNTSTENAYQQTEIGRIPADWEVRRLGEIANIIGGGTPSTTINNYWNGDIEWFTPTEIGSAKYLFGSKRKISQLGFENSSTNILPVNTILLTSRAGIGDLGILKIEASTNQGFQSIVCKENYNVEFIYYLMSTKKVELLRNASGSTFLEISPSKVRDIQIPLPPLPEQEKIAKVLSDTDLWIESNEKLLAKKRFLKQAAMQKLLSPKEDWEETDLRTVAWFQEGPGLRDWQFTSSGMKVINVTNLENGYLNLAKTKRHISLDEFNKMYRHFEIQEKDIVVASSGNSYGKVSVVREKDLPLVMNTSVIRFKPLDKIDYKFLLVFLKSPDFKNQIDMLITGGAQPNFGPVHLNKIKINLPPLKNQQEIAEILSSMDAEIELIESKLQKSRALKQGMMQDLLTGKVRLV